MSSSQKAAYHVGTHPSEPNHAELHESPPVERPCSHRNRETVHVLEKLPNLDVFPQNPRAWFSREHVAEFVYSAELWAATRSHARVTPLIQNEVLHPTVSSVSDSDPLLKAWIVNIVRL